VFSFSKRKKIPHDAAPLAQKLIKTRGSLFGGLVNLFQGRAIDEDLLEDLEAHLLMADVGVEVTAAVLSALRNSVDARRVDDTGAVREELRRILVDILAPCEAPLIVADAQPFVILVTGVNGVGKTTTIGKIAQQLSQAGQSVLLAAGDTFRAAAVEQLAQWAERLNVPLVRQGDGADSASVIFDGLQAARARGVDVLIADTAGRLHTQDGLMAELQKIKRVLGKLDPEAPHETLLVVDGGTGQNAVNQTQQFHAQVGITGIAVTKLDGTAKGGVLFALADRFGIPVRFIGVGETADDLRSFEAQAFVEALLDE
jgi:fused signal recognition particle receptor